jgi:hypothetical protein
VPLGEPGAPASTSVPRSSLPAAAGFAAGVLVLVALVAETQTPVKSLTTPTFVATQQSLALLAFRSFAWGLFAVAAIPFFVVVGGLLRRRSLDGAMAATLLCVIGATLYSLRAIMQDAAWAGASAAASPSASDTAYVQVVLFGMANTLLPLGAAIWGFGYLVIGALAWKSGAVPRWLALVAFIGGVAGWATFPAINSSGAFIGYVFTEFLVPLATAVWGFACGVILLRRG